MPNTYTQLYIQIVFAVKGRENLISKGNREELHKYITGIVQNRDQKLLSIFCMPDHVHLLISIKPTISISDLVRDIKAGSSKFTRAHESFITSRTKTTCCSWSTRHKDDGIYSKHEICLLFGMFSPSVIWFPVVQSS